MLIPANFVQVEFAMRYNHTNTFFGTMLSAYSSVSNYDIEWSFGSSANNASDHRMFEIKIPKSELQHYNANEEIGIIIGGYGTMTFPNELFWVFSEHNTSIRHQISENYLYYDMLGCIAPPGPAIPGYYTPIVLALVIIVSYPILRKKKFKLT